jgi:hypothetical protein
MFLPHEPKYFTWYFTWYGILEERSEITEIQKYWRCRGSNPRPSVCETDALPLSYIPIHVLISELLNNIRLLTSSLICTASTVHECFFAKQNYTARNTTSFVQYICTYLRTNLLPDIQRGAKMNFPCHLV